MSCRERPGGSFHDKKPLVVLTDNEEKTIAKLNNRAAVNLLIKNLADRLGMRLDVSTNSLNNLPTISGDRQNVEQLIDILNNSGGS